MQDEKSILPVSSMLHGEYGIDGISLSMPAIIGHDGIETHVPIQLNDEEYHALKKSAQTLKNVIQGLDFGNSWADEFPDSIKHILFFIQESKCEKQMLSWSLSCLFANVSS